MMLCINSLNMVATPLSVKIDTLTFIVFILSLSTSFQLPLHYVYLGRDFPINSFPFAKNQILLELADSVPCLSG